jgi:hypothetical protein
LVYDKDRDVNSDAKVLVLLSGHGTRQKKLEAKEKGSDSQ